MTELPQPRRDAPGATVLLVEDDADHLELTLQALRESGITDNVAVVRDGVEALDYLFARADRAGHERVRPALVLLDLRLPRLDGMELLRRLRSDARTRRTAIVVLTSSTDERDRARAQELGAAFVSKGADFERLRETIRRVWPGADPGYFPAPEEKS
ncbi:MAG: hypothetical protein A2W18_09360 [Candidatus Muproteobacteria bacterium RBG_16_60_9]|uniref:Response regulatory domain-containing protein n=1 Tax=Candidatus Muproteobacteria bacterium RBG_16_60_9 TaxID=1817755 RepID=A0A1F6V5S8_9PROT|nr:MAG: hypothetical protein A2W18_09360 [Candidatus Muproteobacteria bacterium RBG_16_60_9]